MKRLVFLLTLLVAPAADAGTWAYNCTFTTPTGTTATRPATTLPQDMPLFAIDNYQRACWRFANADGAHNAPQTSGGTLVPVTVTAQSAIICFDPDILQTVTTTARVIPHRCPQGFFADPANPARSCQSTGGENGAASLDGTEGTRTSQNSCIQVGPGAYYFEISVAAEAGDTAQISIEGEGK
jgi:hypothetical protein